ncbi:MAG TPA: YraN family protein [Bacteroidota bacterium]|nr:YraN family protein [Bacteroidota bacterium]
MTGFLGDRGERTAAEFLERNGYEILQRNYRFGRGEIDLIARKNGTTVFIEVKTRSSDRYGEPEEAVTREKVRRIRRIASAYLAQRRIGDCDCRFDVIAVVFDGDRPTVRHTQDIFS